MSKYFPLALVLASACTIGVLTAAVRPAEAADSMEIVIGNGPHAGTYKLAPGNMICMNVKVRKQFSAAYKDTKAKDAKTISGVGVNVFNPDDAGPKRGEINIRFGDPDDKRPATYEIDIRGDSKTPVTLAKKGKTADVSFDGQTAKGTKIRITAKCDNVDEF